MIRKLAEQVKEYKGASIATPLFMLLEVAMEMMIPLEMGNILDKGIQGNSLQAIFFYGGIMILLALVGLFAGFAGGKYGARASAGFARNLREALFRKVQTFSFANIDHFSTASLVTRMTTDVTNLQNAYQMLLRMAVRAPASLIVAMLMAFYINARLASIYLVIVLLLGLFLFVIISVVRQIFRQVFREYDNLNESVQENVTGIRVVKAYVRESREKEVFSKTSKALRKMFVKAESIIATGIPAMSLAAYGSILLISWFGAHMIVSSELTTGELVSLLAYSMNILMSLMMLSFVFVMITMSAASAERIVAVLEEEPEIVNPKDPLMEVPNGEIVFDHVNFAYKKKAENFVLSDINLTIRSGETIGIMGATGSAKTSLVNLISRLYDISGGSLKVGGNDVRDYDLKTLRDAVSVVLQNNVLFTGTIAENLRWGNKTATDEELRRAAKMACADEFIDRFPEGYDTFIEQGGTNVSGGQRQRLCIARALLKKPRVLILDDSTSAVDTTTDARIRKAFREDIPDTTKIIISQRVSSVRDADRIIIMDDGRVNAFDTPEHLLESNDIYRDIYEAQTQGGSGDFDENGGED
ncbi:ABC transporter ATP-binding protein [Shuttleworthella satelles]|uniref:ABC transporter, ATP-binding protein n=1 Tax=Shuttleworthella satelles DSM 14600 TaxID=626523 RepID=C4GD30_9FIRM|nr:ABC transporter ATP-binding protein [Shuttleworthia satelles]EEP27880.1 ABC transporter, ATP-binding protein [Shuttleworthia satelles DSM 14600]